MIKTTKSVRMEHEETGIVVSYAGDVDLQITIYHGDKLIAQMELDTANALFNVLSEIMDEADV